MSAPHDPSIAAADPAQSAWVAAHAGAGKTHTLANRVSASAFFHPTHHARGRIKPVC